MVQKKSEEIQNAPASEDELVGTKKTVQPKKSLSTCKKWMFEYWTNGYLLQ